MADKPIIFSAAMVNALLSGRKTQTRRIIKKKAAHDALATFGPVFLSLPGNRDLLPINVIPGDRLWVKEAWRTADAYDDLPPRDLGGEEAIWYEVDGHIQTWGWPEAGTKGRYRNARFMPRWASRLTLTVTDVRVQRLQEISEVDVAAEGITRGFSGGPYGEEGLYEDFSDLWNSLHGPDAWDANPWVVALTFDVRYGNIDNT